MTLIAAFCPVCGGSTFGPVYTATISDPDSDPAAYFSSSRHRAGYLSIVRCRRCELMLTNPRDDDATIAQIYTALEDKVYAAEADTRRRTAEEHLALVAAHHPRPGRLLDVGCATGTFVCVAQRAGWEATGLDASGWAIARARELCPQATFVAGLLEEAAFPAAGFAAITLWDVIEHVPSPAETLSHVHRWLAPGGSLFLNMPNADSFIARRMGRHWVLLLREHLWYFSPSTIGRLLRQNGFELVRTSPNFVRFSLASIAGRLARYPNVLGRFARPLENVELLKRWDVRFPIGEMNVVARKNAAVTTVPV
jgi:SAM-dependent methyltransferase